MEEEKYHVWFSANQKEYCRQEDIEKGNKQQIIYAKMDTGGIAEYTEMTKGIKPSGLWRDYKYLGTGEFDHRAYV